MLLYDLVTRLEYDGSVVHAELELGDSRFFIGEKKSIVVPEAGASIPISLHLYVPDVDAFVEHAVAAGAEIFMAVKDQFYGDRSGLPSLSTVTISI